MEFPQNPLFGILKFSRAVSKAELMDFDFALWTLGCNFKMMDHHYERSQLKIVSSVIYCSESHTVTFVKYTPDWVRILVKYAFFGKKIRVQDLLVEHVMNRRLA